ncbi:MAG TPA: GatB/YqeY domain-containing protein [Saprospiraceae bacterium]|nr:GatB/YqeY domain-containing protein [Saprospiraceae bacterium]HNH67187.1 GatB/YqeY domain-containing protein [Bacteroidia bacterium]MCC6687981.1 GatB/YqeY domain-containing protein [Saprospiraceae bacterium]HMX81711.1 GatB/YqeY domain-containing protein [Saprospiraceae bacterium]HMX84569.1 GatB/YqeY domain-containing protein [Saprospiraceae bacterium]
MSLEAKITEDLKEAMRNKDQAALRAIRAVKSAILLFKTSGTQEELNEENEIKLLQKLVKQRKDSLEIYRQQNRPELASVEEEEIAVIEKYLPKQLSAEELSAFISKLIADNGVSEMKEMGKVIGLASKALAGQAEGKAISEEVKKQLSK